jgi:UDP-glucose 4-epimerase
MPDNQRRILVTGGAGFIGAHLVTRLLTDGHHVAVLDNLSTGTHANLAPCRAGGLHPRDLLVSDIAHPSAIAVIAGWQPQIIVHLAAQARVTRSVADIAHDAATNVLGTIHVLEGARAAHAQRVVLASSGGTIFGELPAGQAGFTEAAARAPISPYGTSKTAADSYAHLYAALYDLRSVVLALGNVYGTRPDGKPCPDVIPQFATTMIAGQAPTVRGDGSQTRDFVHVHDAAEAFRLACLADLPDTTTMINIGSGVETPINDVVRLLAQHLPAAPACRYVAPLPYEVTRNCLHNDTAAALLGWRPLIDLPTGIARVVAELTPTRQDLTQAPCDLERIAA